MVNTNKKTSPKSIFRQLFVILSGLSFVYFSIYGVIKMLQAPNNTPSPQQEKTSPEQLLEKEAEGYKLVLKREPNNRFALEKLAEIYLKGGDLVSALPVVEKLVALEPENQRYQQALAFIKQGLAQKQPSKENPTPTNPSSPSK